MAQIFQILGEREMYSVGPQETVAAVAAKMAARHVGAILVLEDGELRGIFSERDLLQRVVAAGQDPRAVLVRDVMTPQPAAISDAASADEAMEIMQRNNCRHLPVLRDGKVVQLVSMRDLMYFDLDRKAEEIRHMKDYIQGAA